MSFINCLSKEYCEKSNPKKYESFTKEMAMWAEKRFKDIIESIYSIKKRYDKQRGRYRGESSSEKDMLEYCDDYLKKHYRFKYLSSIHLLFKDDNQKAVDFIDKIHAHNPFEDADLKYIYEKIKLYNIKVHSKELKESLIDYHQRSVKKNTDEYKDQEKTFLSNIQKGEDALLDIEKTFCGKDN